MERAVIQNLNNFVGKEISLKGWLTNKRSGKGLEFLIVRDGTGYVQCIVNEDDVNEKVFNIAKSLSQESSIEISGLVVKDERQVGGYEIQLDNLKLISEASAFPITNKPHGVEFLMDNRHLWLRSKRQWAIMRVRNRLIFAVHSFFQNEDFIQMDAPIFTGNAVEGTSTLFESKFYDETAYLSQSGQLYGEAMAMAMGKIYTFGPTFRAEKSKTRRHLSEFWMIEPEMAFFDNDMNMDLIEKFIKHIVKEVRDNCSFEFEILERDTKIFDKIIEDEFPRLTYDNAVGILKGDEKVDGKTTIETLENDLILVLEGIKDKSKEIEEAEKTIKGGVKKGKRNYLQNKIDTIKNEIKDLEERKRVIPQWVESAKKFKYGSDLGGSDETVLTRMFELPVMVYNWPHEIKAFYMKRDADSPEMAKGVDLLAPEGYGEIVGGGERETDLNLLIEKINEHKLPMKAFEWYLDLRRFGSVPHAGFGLGLERMVAWVCKLKHIRETIPFPRMYGRLFP
ncbi:MAG: asparagine--tRNA ligase [Bacteroidetes bacterium 4572_117]|nr:MAG: asparagine--tRNA ligase [Bacteroidetes bacterium 4572_117]